MESSFAITALDDDFFGDTPSSNGGVQVLDPNFFNNSRGRLENAPAGSYGCTSVWAKTPSGESGKIGSKAQAYCDGAPSVRWIPNMKAWRNVPMSYNNNNDVGGYYQICCVRKTSGSRRAMEEKLFNSTPRKRLK